MSDLYQEIILEHYKHPHNEGELPDADQSIEEANQSCGDTFTFQVKIKEKAGKKIISDIKFQGQGCAISTAASSLLTDELKGQPVSKVSEIDLNFMQELIGTPVTFTRQKCLMLPARALQKLSR